MRDFCLCILSFVLLIHPGGPGCSLAVVVLPFIAVLHVSYLSSCGCSCSCSSSCCCQYFFLVFFFFVFPVVQFTSPFPHFISPCFLPLFLFFFCFGGGGGGSLFSLGFLFDGKDRFVCFGRFRLRFGGPNGCLNLP